MRTRFTSEKLRKFQKVTAYSMGPITHPRLRHESLIKLRMPADEAAFLFEKLVQARQRANVGFDRFSVLCLGPHVKCSSRQVAANFRTLVLRHLVHHLGEA